MDNLQHGYIDACRKVDIRPNSKLLVALNVSPSELKKLDLSGNYFGSDCGFRCVAEAFRRATCLEELNMSNNYLTTENVQDLAECLLDHPAIRRLVLHQNRLYIDSGKALLRLVKLNKRVTEVELHDSAGSPVDNKIPDKIMGQLARELEANRAVLHDHP